MQMALVPGTWNLGNRNQSIRVHWLIVISQPNNKPTIWGWFIQPICVWFRGWFIIGCTTLNYHSSRSVVSEQPPQPTEPFAADSAQSSLSTSHYQSLSFALDLRTEHQRIINAPCEVVGLSKMVVVIANCYPPQINQTWQWEIHLL